MNARRLALVPVAAALMAFGAPAAAASLTYQDVTFESIALDADTIVFSILDATSATGNWSGVNYLKGFEIKEIGSVTGATISPSDLAAVDYNMNAAGCGGPAGSQGICFLAGTPLTLTDAMSWEITFAGSNLNFDSPHLKVSFYETLTQTKKTGDLLSMNLVSPIPEPETYAMLLAGLALMGFVARRRRAARGGEASESSPLAPA